MLQGSTYGIKNLTIMRSFKNTDIETNADYGIELFKIEALKFPHIKVTFVKLNFQLAGDTIAIADHRFLFRKTKKA